MPDFTPPSSVIGADRTGTIAWRTTGRQTWSIGQITTKADLVGGGAVCEVRKNGKRITLMVPTGDTAADAPPLDQGPVDTVDVHWTGGVVGATIEVTSVIYDEK